MLKKILEEIRIDRADINTPPGGDADKIIRMCYKRVEKIINKHMNDGWVPCAERLPDNSNSVLMCSETGCVDVGWWTGKRWVTGFSHADIARDIIAWRPLPESYHPEKGAEE